MIKVFNSKAEKEAYEQERYEYYADRIYKINNNFLWAYVDIFLSIFSSKEKALKAKFDNYEGGIWKDALGNFHVDHISIATIDPSLFSTGDLIIEECDERTYAFYKDEFWMV